MNSGIIIFVVGPTAVGKTGLACDVAQASGAEIVSCDAMQIYREATVVSSKPAAEVLDRVPHHLLNVCSVTEEFDVAMYNRLAAQAIDGIWSRGRVPLVVGGSGLYMQVLLDGIFSKGPRDEAVRAALLSRLSSAGQGSLYDELRAVDPLAAQKIHPHDTRRVIRALEVFRLTRQPISRLQPQRSGLWGQARIRIFALTRDRAELYRRINERVDEMFEQGLEAEIRALLALPLSRTAAQMIGVPELRGYLRGEYDQGRARELLKMHTRRYAKRQLTWLRRDARVEWLVLDGPPGEQRARETISAALRGAR